MPAPRMGKVQLRIMQVLWGRDQGRATAREITDALNQTSPIAHSTVQTLLRKLEDKGALDHHVKDRTFVFYPLVKAAPVTKGATRELIERVFGGSPAGLVAHLLKHERISKAELQRLRKLIDEKEE